MTEATFLRVLVVEDDERRIERIKRLCPPGLRLVIARTGGQAIGVLQRDPEDTYAAILLDHDLKHLGNGEYRSGTDVAKAIARCASPDTEVFVHSANVTKGDLVAGFLRDNGFHVERQMFWEIPDGRLREYLEDLL